MNETPLVSICCITYNHAPFIRKCLDGFLMQRVDFPIEILIHDDCSTDGTTEIIKEYAAKYPDIMFPLYEETNQYDPDCPNKMDMYNYKRVRGKYIAYCEGDDYWTDPLKLQKQVEFLEAHPDYSVTFHRCKHFNVEDGTEKDDQCAFLFQNGEDGVDISIDMFFEKWITQPLSMVCRTSMHDISLFYKYKYFRDQHEIYHLLKEGKGYLFSWYGGRRIIHMGGVASSQNAYEMCAFELESANELFSKENNSNTNQYWRSVVLWTLNTYKGKMYWSFIVNEFRLFSVKFIFVYLIHLKRKLKSSTQIFLNYSKKYLYDWVYPVKGEAWQLHRVRPNLSDDENLRTYEITPTRLEYIIKDYLAKGYEFVSMDTVCQYVMHNARCKRKFVAVTLDDGYEDNYSVAYPIFKKYNIPFCIFIAQSYITGEKKSSEIVDFKMLSIEQIRDLSKEPLCTLGGHTRSHIRLNTLPVKDQEVEIVECKQWLECVIGKSVEHYAFPYGDYTDETLDIIAKSGVKGSVAAWGGGVRVTKRPYNIPRVLVTEEYIR